MKTLVALIFLLNLSGCMTVRHHDTFNNPLPVAFGDPYILKASDGFYYMIGTGGVRDGFKMYSSADLKEWKDEGRIYQGNTESSWNVANFWAPELYEIDGRFYLLFSADWALAKGLFNEIEESWVYGVEMKPDFSGIVGEPKLLLRPPVSMSDPQTEWESRSVTAGPPKPAIAGLSSSMRWKS